ncbi:MAG: ribbon-helix-helix domain-containing protein [Alphaproteobacteria bacterium]
MASALVSRNITVSGRRTSMRLEPAMWDALEDICRRERCRLAELCSAVDSHRGASSLTAGVRVFILDYFRSRARLALVAGADSPVQALAAEQAQRALQGR